MTGTMYSSRWLPRSRSNITTLDGTLTINADGLNALPVEGTTLGMDGVREYKVITNLAGLGATSPAWAARPPLSAEAAPIN